MVSTRSRVPDDLGLHKKTTAIITRWGETYVPCNTASGFMRELGHLLLSSERGAPSPQPLINDTFTDEQNLIYSEPLT